MRRPRFVAPSRRGALAIGLGGAALLGFGGARLAFSPLRGSDEVVSLDIVAQSVAALLPESPGERHFGALAFRGGLALTSTFSGFGGLSALWRSPDGGRIVALSDNAQWLTAAVTSRDGRLAGLAAARMAPILGADAVPLRRGPTYDTESLAMAGDMAFVGIERVHEIRRFAWARDGFAARGEPIEVPPEVKTLPSNKSLEALAVAPLGHPLAGALIAIAEQARPGDDAPTRGWILTGPRPGAFDVVRSAGFDVTDLTFLESGEALLLERRFSLARGVACRIRRLPPEAFLPGALVDGPVIFEADRRFEIDNMEGIAAHRDPASGETIVTLVSDDNFNPFQRTLLLEFALAG